MKRKGTVGVHQRFLNILIWVLVFLILLIIRIGWIQFVRGDEYSKDAALQQTKDVEISSKRGTIYDRNMKELAKSASTETVTVCPREIIEADKVKETSDELAKILDMDKEEVYEILSKPSSYEVIKRKIDKKQADRIREKNFVGVDLIEDFKRYYPGGSLASHVVGFVGSDSQGLAGVEMIYESYLKGVPGRIITAKNATGTNMPYKYEKYIDPENGVNVVLTIDEIIQRKVEDTLKKTSEDYQVENGASCIVMNAKTGEIYAMATYPGFDLNAPFTIVDEDLKEAIDEIEDEEKRNKATTEALNKQWRNKAVVDAYEPGSTFKSMVAAMAIEENIVSLNENLVCTGSMHFGDHTIKCHNVYGHGNETFVQGVYNSCNPVFMTIGTRLGSSRFYKYYKAFGFGEPTGFDLPGEAAGTFHSMDRFNEVELATSSFGQSFTVTPLQLITAYSAITNDGYMVKPRLIKSLVDNDGNIIKNFETETVRQVISSETANTVCEILEGVASDGTSKNAYIEGYRVAGKTGTSEKLPRGNGKYIASFAGFAPADDPEIICLIMFDEPMGGQYMGGQLAAPAFKEIMSDVLVYLQIQNSSNTTYNFVPGVVGKEVKEAQSEVSGSGLRYMKMGSGEKVIAQSPVAGTALGENGVVILYTEETENDTVAVPDLHGRLASEANQILRSSGLNMKVKGSNDVSGNVLVGTQSPEAGTEVARGSIVTVEYNYTDNVH